ncbi:hypothetical protein [Erythrobacter alti]|uniref:hypothetical protein n=1 Tax=Erythrobacter alti TaxID=1896145 RepID=UPI0030F3A612
MIARHALLAAILVTSLAACDRSDPPVKKLERAAEDMMGEVQGENLPRQAKGPYAPRNECLDQPGAAEFLLDLRNAAAARNADALVALSADDIMLDFGGGAGTELLRERLAEESGYLWNALDEVLILGCASDGARMTMPWYFTQDIKADPYMGAIVMGEDVPLYRSASEDSEVLGQISWNIVEAQEGRREGDRFAEVIWINPNDDTPVEGYVEVEKLRSIIDYRLIVTRRNNRWRITNFIAGD